MKNIFTLIFASTLLWSCSSSANKEKTSLVNSQTAWDISILPPSVRIDPITGDVIENRFKGVENQRYNYSANKNWVFDGDKAVFHCARGEYFSFQVILNNYTDSTLRDIKITIPAFKNSQTEIYIKPELFLEWFAYVETPSTGYAKTSLGKGWYPDALIPLDCIQYDSAKVEGRWTYPLWLPDFNNRITGQHTMAFWVDQFIPLDVSSATPGTYTSEIEINVAGTTKKIDLELELWDFAIPTENKLKASLQEEGFLSSRDEKSELEIYQLFKKHRIGLMDPTYQPELQVDKNNKVKIDWTKFDARLKKYFTGEAFTKKFGYEYGPGYGEPVETFMLPFDVYGKHHTSGWPDIGSPETEKNDKNSGIYIDAIHQVRTHLMPMINPQKTDITVYLNGLDESYFKEALDRMIYYGNLFREHYPEANFRIDGAYDDKDMEYVGKSISAWASHTINYDIDRITKFQKMGIKDWLYGPMLYEGKVNSWVGSSTFTDLPLINDRAISWAVWKYNTYSWLSWGIGVGGKSAWYDPETWKDAYKQGADSDPEFTYKKLNGSALLIYEPGIIPNVDKYCPSIRLKAMRDGIQDYEYLRYLTTIENNSVHADEIVNDIIKQPFGEKSIGNIDVWSFNAEQWDNSRIRLGKLISAKINQNQ